MDYGKLKRDGAFVLSNLVEAKDGSWVTKKKCTIVIPAKYKNRGLADLENKTRVIAIFAIVMGDKYGVMKVNANIDLLPSSTRTVEFDGEEYIEFEFEAGQKLSESLNLVQISVLAYNINEHFISKGDVPWFFDYQDVSELFDTCVKHAGTDLNVDPAILELIAASLARQPKDRTKYIRHILTKQSDFNSTPVANISLKNIELGATNTTAKLMGNYYREGLSSALVSKTEQVEGIEELLRR